MNNTLEGLRSGVVDDILELPADASELNVVARVPDGSDRRDYIASGFTWVGVRCSSCPHMRTEARMWLHCPKEG